MNYAIGAKSFRVTRHAIQRYRERVEDCSKAEAIDRLLHAAEISRPPSMREMRKASINCGTSAVLMICPVVPLLLIGLREGMQVVLLTVIRLEAQ